MRRVKKRAGNKALINTLARKMGRAAGTLVKATQGLAADAAAMVKIDRPRRKPAKPRRRSAPKRTGRATRISARSSRKAKV